MTDTDVKKTACSKCSYFVHVQKNQKEILLNAKLIPTCCFHLDCFGKKESEHCDMFLEFNHKD